MPDIAVASSTIAAGVLLGGMLGLTALGLSIILGVMRLVNLAHGEFLLLGAYFGLFFVQATGVDPLIGAPLVSAAIAILSVPFYWLLLRPLAQRGAEAQMMTMFATSIILQNLYVLLFSADTRSIPARYASTPLTLGPVTVPATYVIGFSISVAAILSVHYLVSRTSFGRDLRASAVDPSAASTLGVNVQRVQMLTFALGAACAGMGGVLIGTAFQFGPSSGAAYLLNSLAIVVLGGLGNVLGSLIGGIALGALQSLGGLTLGDGYRDVVGMALFLVVLAFRPGGIGRVRA